MNAPFNAATTPFIRETPDYFRLSRRVFVEPEIYQRELDVIFGKCWLFIGHESEIPEKGDFVVRTVGGRNVMLVHGVDGVVRAMYNVCAHRGAVLCRETSGNAKLFRCMYHAWAFDTTGKTVARPQPERYPPSSFDDGEYDLTPVAHTDHHRGFYFVNYDPNAGTLSDYLGGAAEFLDRIADKTEVGLEVVGGLNPFGVHGNWKSATENFIDLYHVAPLHATYFEYLAKREPDIERPPLPGGAPFEMHRTFGNGHTVIENRRKSASGRPVAQAAASWGEAGRKEVAEILARLEKRLGKERADVVANNNANVVIFPNFIVSDNFVTSVRTYEPNGRGETVCNSWLMAPKEESPVMRKHRIKNMIEFMGPGGLAQADDAEAVLQVFNGFENLPTGWNDISRGMGMNDHDSSDETSMRVYWREWNRRMLGE